MHEFGAEVSRIYAETQFAVQCELRHSSRSGGCIHSVLGGFAAAVRGGANGGDIEHGSQRASSSVAAPMNPGTDWGLRTRGYAGCPGTRSVRWQRNKGFGGTATQYCVLTKHSSLISSISAGQTLNTVEHSRHSTVLVGRGKTGFAAAGWRVSVYKGVIFS